MDAGSRSAWSPDKFNEWLEGRLDDIVCMQLNSKPIYGLVKLIT